MSSTNTPQDPYGTGDERDRASGSTPPPYGSTPPPPSGDSGQSYGSTPPPYGSTPPAYGAPPAYGTTSSGAGSSSYGAPGAYGSTPPAYGSEYGGAPSPYGYGSYPKNNLGVWSLVLGLVGIFVCGLFAGIPAVVVGNRSKRAVAEGQANNPGMATAGVVLGWISIVLSLLGVIAFIALVATGALTETVSTTNSF